MNGGYIKLVNGDYKGGFNNLEKYESQIGSSQLLGGKKMFQTTNQYDLISWFIPH